MSLLRLKSSVVLAISALLGLIVSLGLLYLVQRQAAVESIGVVVAAEAIAEGTPLTASMLEQAAWPAHLKPFTALQSVDDAVGRVTRKALLAGEPVQDESLWARGVKGDLKDQLETGHRAISIRINELIGVTAKDLVGQFVDLVGTRREGDNPAVTEPIVERVKVLAVATTGGNQTAVSIRGITISANAEQVSRIEKARLAGSITALMRNPRDTQRLGEEKIPASVVSPSAPIRTPTRAEKPSVSPEVELILGSQRVPAR